MSELTTVATVRSYLGDSTADSTLVQMAIDAAEIRIAQMCGRQDHVAGANWLTASRTEYIDGDMSQNVLLKFTPITAIGSVTITTSATGSIAVALTNLDCDGIPVASLSSSVPGQVGRLGWRQTTTTVSQWFDYGFPRPNWMWSVGTPNFGDGRNRVVIAYTGGYTSVPGDLALAATALAANMFKVRLRDQGLTSQRLGDFAQSYGTDAEEAVGLTSVQNMISGRLRIIA